MAVNKFRFGISKTVGSPSVEGAIGVETLASHASNPSAHADYVRKGAIPRTFDESHHLLDKLSHADAFLRRDEVMTSHLEYVTAKLKSYTGDTENYKKQFGLQRHVVTAFVLNQVLDDLGLLNGTKDFFLKGNIVTTTGSVPTEKLDEYVPSYAYFTSQLKSFSSNWEAFKKLFEQVREEITQIHEIADTARECAAKTGYLLTEDAKFISGKKYYVYNSSTKSMVVATVVPGEDVPPNVYYENIRDLEVRTYAHAGYFLTKDTTHDPDKKYYQYDWGTETMVEITGSTGFPTDYWEKLSESQASHREYIATVADTISTYEYTIDATSLTEGSSVLVKEITNEFDPTEINYQVALIGQKAGTTYIFPDPIAEIADPSETDYVPIYVPAVSLVSGRNKTTKGIYMVGPHSWLDTGTGIKTMETLSIRIRAKRINFAS